MEIQVVSGFLGSGKTTFLNQYLPCLQGKTVVIENEFGNVGLDGELIQEDVPVREIYAGCICCSLAIDFQKAIKELKEQFSPGRLVIEPSGVGRLSDIVKACNTDREKEKIELTITKLITIVDIKSFEEYREDFGAFYIDQISHAGLILLSNLDGVEHEKKLRLIEEIRKENVLAVIYNGDYRELDSCELQDLVSSAPDYEMSSAEPERQAFPAGRVFSSVSIKEISEFTQEDFQLFEDRLKGIENGQILRAKGILNIEGKQIHFDYTPFVYEVREVDIKKNQKTKVAIIGCDLNDEEIKALFFKEEC